jgi:hypothetical protein
MTVRTGSAYKAWTPRQAGYDLPATVVTTSHGDGGFTQHYVPTRHGAVCRTWTAPSMTEVALCRTSNTGATFQGEVKHFSYGGWIAYDHNGQQVCDPFADYLDAEATLLRLRGGRRCQATYRWNVLPVRSTRS